MEISRYSPGLAEAAETGKRGIYLSATIPGPNTSTHYHSSDVREHEIIGSRSIHQVSVTIRTYSIHNSR